MAFNAILPRAVNLPLWESKGAEGVDKSEKAEVLQKLFDAGQTRLYEDTKHEFEEGGAHFRVTAGKIFEVFDSDRRMNIPIQVQVVGGTITWYFVAPQDETKQEDRDKLYQAAALGHVTHVKDHCEKYWRGTNSLHVKKMHTHASEAKKNHNHYRLIKDKDCGPEDFEQHIMGFVEAQREMGLFVQEGTEKKELFLTEAEAKELVHKFKVFHARITHVGQACIKEVDGERIDLKERSISILQAFKESPEHKLTEEDLLEWNAFGDLEEPCKTITKDMPLKQKKAAIQQAMRGIGSELAWARNMDNVGNLSLDQLVPRDDRLGDAAPTTNIIKTYVHLFKEKVGSSGGDVDAGKEKIESGGKSDNISSSSGSSRSGGD